MMTSQEAYRKAQDDIHSAIAKIFRELADNLGEDHKMYSAYKGMCQGYMLITEWHGIEGDKKCDLLPSEDARLWNIEGWIGFVQKDIQAQHIANHLEGRE